MKTIKDFFGLVDLEDPFDGLGTDDIKLKVVDDYRLVIAESRIVR